MAHKAEIGIIGGSGIYDPDIIENIEQVTVQTPYGNPSSKITLGELEGRKVAIIARHGEKHNISPSNVNYRANIHALKDLGVKQVISANAVGSLKEDIEPGELVFPDQFIDRTTKRISTFYDKDQVCHISVAEPVCKEMHTLYSKIANEMHFSHHEKGTIVVIEGPRFSTKAESQLFRSWNADIIGMTMVPECVLAREAEMCYAMIAMVTDYDVWYTHHVSIDEVIKTMKANEEKVKGMLSAVIPRLPEERKCYCGKALKEALI